MLTDDDGATTALPFTLVASADPVGRDSGADGGEDTGGSSFDLPECGCTSATWSGPTISCDGIHRDDDCSGCAGDVVLFIVFFPFSMLWLALRR